MAPLSSGFDFDAWSLMQALQPQCRLNDPGLGYSPFARHYLGNHCCFLFLRVLRCFSSPGSLSLRSDWSSTSRVAPFGNLRIKAYLQLPVAYRSLSRPSSPSHAKASTIRSFLLKNQRISHITPLHSYRTDYFNRQAGFYNLHEFAISLSEIFTRFTLAETTNMSMNSAFTYKEGLWS